jgi:hypothetical protein
MKATVGGYIGDARDYSEQWQPGNFRAISEVREKNSSSTLKCGASELLEVYPVLRAFAIACYGVLATEPHVVSFLLLCLICDEIRDLLKGKEGKLAEEAAQRLRALIKKYMVAFVAAYGSAAVRFKHHQLLHIPDQIWLLKRLVSCWVHERKHIQAKLALQHHKTGATMAACGMNRMLNNQMHFLENPGWLSALEFAKPYPEMALSLGAGRVEISTKMRWNGALIGCKDVVFLNFERTYMVVVVGCVGIDDAFGLLVRCCTRSSCTGTASCWDVDPDVTLYRLVDEPVLKASAYKYDCSNKLEVLH